ncbi:MAG: hypothetical protein AAB229_08610 [Candidatus Hydrogenedentota bacterium]
MLAAALSTPTSTLARAAIRFCLEGERREALLKHLVACRKGDKVLAMMAAAVSENEDGFKPTSFRGMILILRKAVLSPVSKENATKPDFLRVIERQGATSLIVALARISASMPEIRRAESLLWEQQNHGLDLRSQTAALYHEKRVLRISDHPSRKKDDTADAIRRRLLEGSISRKELFTVISNDGVRGGEAKKLARVATLLLSDCEVREALARLLPDLGKPPGMISLSYIMHGVIEASKRSLQPRALSIGEYAILTKQPEKWFFAPTCTPAYIQKGSRLRVIHDSLEITVVEGVDKESQNGVAVEAPLADKFAFLVPLAVGLE